MSGKHRRPQEATRRGFTLLELLVVIAIILILASVTVAGFSAMARGRSLGQSASTVRTTIMQAASYANQYNVRTRVLCGAEQVKQSVNHYMIIEYYNPLEDPTPDDVYEDVAWCPLGVDMYSSGSLVDRAVRLAEANRDYLSGTVKFFPAQDPISPLQRGNGGVVKLPTTGVTDQIHFLPSGAVAEWTDQDGDVHGRENQQVGLASLGEQEVEKKTVIVLRASGLTYIEDAYGEGDY
jgi:prepilin-type N-terminal cleavage/methylation domain-containing protein